METCRTKIGIVRTVNGQTGDVTVYVPYKISEFLNDVPYATQEDVDSKYAYVENQIGEINDNIDKINDDITEINRVLETKADKVYVDEQISETREFIQEEIKETRDYIDQNVNTLQDEINDINEDIAEINRVLETKANITYVNSQIKDTRDYIDELIAGIENKLETVNQTIKTIQDDIEEIQSNISDIQKDIKDLQDNKQDKLTPGTGIEITKDNVINVTLDTEILIVSDKLPETGIENKIYLIPAEDGETGNIYNEYIWKNNTWEKIGQDKIDLSGYYNKEEIDDITENIEKEIEGVSDAVDTLDQKIDKAIEDQGVVDKSQNDAIQALQEELDQKEDKTGEWIGKAEDYEKIEEKDPKIFYFITDEEIIEPYFYIQPLEDGGTYEITQQGTDTRGKTMKYAINNTNNWQNYIFGTKIPANANDKIYFLSDDEITMSMSALIYKQLAGTKKYTVGGDIMSLMNFTKKIDTNMAFYQFIANEPNLIIIDNLILSATELAPYSYSSMFKNCTGLTTVSENLLPAMELSTNCYNSMFQGCTNLIQAPKLPAITKQENSYYNMFRDCKQLKEIYCNLIYWKPGEIISNYIDSNWLYGVSNTTDCIFYKNPDWTGPTYRNGNSILSNWQLVDWNQ